MDNSEKANEFKLQGNQFLKEKNYEEAYKMYSQAIELLPNDHIFYSNRSCCLIYLNKFEESLNDANKCIELSNNFVTGYSRKGLALFKLGNLEEAKNSYNDGLKLEPENKSCLSGLKIVESNIQQQGNSAMNPLLQKLFQHPKFLNYMQDPSFKAIFMDIQQNPNNLSKYLSDPRVMDLMSVLIPQGGQNNKNTTNNNQETQEEPKLEPKVEPKVEPKKETPKNDLKLKADNFYRSKNFMEAIETYRSVLEENNKNLLIYNNIAACYIELKEYDEAEKSIDKALELYSELNYDEKEIEHFAKLYTRKARVFELREQYDEAINCVKKADLEFKLKTNFDYLRKLKRQKTKKDQADYLNPELSEKHRDNGNKLFKDGKFKEAIEEYEEAGKRNPKDPKVFNNIAMAYIKTLRYDLAMEFVNKSLNIDPNFTMALLRKGKIHNFLKEHHKAIDIFEKILSKDPQNVSASKLLNETKMKIQSSMNSGTDEERAKRAMSDPEIQSIINDPMVKLALSKIQENPQCAMEYFNDSNMGPKLQKLIQAGIIKTG